jgi:hypothetical protein
MRKQNTVIFSNILILFSNYLGYLLKFYFYTIINLENTRLISESRTLQLYKIMYSADKCFT